MLIIMNSHTLFLDKRIIAGGIHLNAGCQGYRPQRAVRCKRHIIGFCHGGNFLHFRNPSGMRQIRLDDIHASGLKQPFKVIF